MKNGFLKNHLFLFDIDGTIIDIKGKGKDAFFYAFEKVNNVKILEDISFLGGIDNIIYKNLYKTFQLPENLFDNRWTEFKNIYKKILQKIKVILQHKLFRNGNRIKYYRRGY